MRYQLGMYKEISLKKVFQNRFFHDIGRYSSSTTISQAVMMVYTIVVARSLGPESFGQFSGSYALAGLTAFVVSWGMDTWLLREPGSLQAPRAWSGRVLRVKASTGVAWGLLLTFISPLIRPDIFAPSLMLICVVDVWFDNIMITHIAALNIQQRIKAVSRLMLFSRLFRLLGAFAVICIGSNGPFEFALARCLATAGGALAAMLVLKPDFRGDRLPSNREILRMSTPYGVSELFALIYMQADVALLTLLKGSSAAGLYSPASGLTNALFIVPATIFNLVVPRLSRQYIENPEKLTKRIKPLSIGFAGLGIALALGLFVAGGIALRLVLGSRYLVSSVVIEFLSPLLFFKTIGFGWAAFLVAVGWQKQRLIPQAVSAATNVVANLWVIPRFGLVGVALVYVASEFVLSVGYGSLVLKWRKDMFMRSGQHLVE